MMAERVPIDTYCKKKIPTLQKTHNGLIDYVDISSVDNTEKRIISYQTIESNDAPSRAKQLLQKGDVLVSTVRPNLNAVAVVEEETENLMVGSTGYCVLRCKENIDVRYLFNFCQSQYFVDDMSSQATGASYPAVSNGIVRSSLIPCYSIKEQREIAEKMDTVSELLALRKQQLAEMDELIKSRFVELFGDPIFNPMGWEVADFKEVVYFQEGPGVRNWQFRDSGIKLINIRNLIDDKLVLENTSNYLSGQEVEEKYKHFLLDVGDYVMASSGVTWGKIAEIFEEHLPLCLNTSIIRLRPYDENVISKKYLFHYIKGDAFRTQIKRLITGSAQPNFGPTHLKQISILLPPIELQNQFAAFIEQTDKSKLVIQQSLDKLELLKKSLMQKYFG